MHNVVKKTLDTINEHNLICPDDAVFVALSGGADSVCLLHVLISLRDCLRYRSLTALHLHHGLRGEDADRDEEFVQKLCAEWGIRLLVGHVDTRLEAETHGESVEEAGRRLRYHFFEECMEGTRCAILATAHHADDHAETVMMNMFRGCGLKGLSGIPLRRGNIVRPFLKIRSDDIRRYCREAELGFVTDETNFSTEYTRNRLRCHVMPLIETIHPRAVDNVLKLSSIAAEEDAYLESVASEAAGKMRTSYEHVYTIKTVLMMPDVILRRALMMLADREGVQHLERTHIDEMLHVAKNGGSCSLPHRITIHCDGDMLVFDDGHRDEISRPVRIREGEEFVFGSKTYKAEIISYEEYEIRRNVHKNLFNFCVAYDMIRGDLIMRTRSDGDRFRPYKRHCTKTLKKWFNEQHIPPFLRDSIEILCDDDGVIGVLGMAVDDRAAVKSDSRVLLIKTQKKGL